MSSCFFPAMSLSDSSDPADSAGTDLTFEEAFGQLEEVVDAMENGQIPLNDLIENYEAGTRLFRLCQARLEEAEGRIEMIRQKVQNGEATLEVEAFDPDAPAAAAAAEEANIPESTAGSAAKPSLKEDGELF